MKTQLIRYQYVPGEVTKLCDEAIAKATERLQAIVSTPLNQRKIENTLLAFEEIISDFSDAVTPLTFMGYVSTDEKISRESSECEQKVNQFSVAVFTRKDLYLAIKEQKGLSPNQNRLHFETVLAFEDNGLKLSDSQLAEMKNLKQTLSALETEFSTNLNQDKTQIEFTTEELKGVPLDYLNSLRKTPTGKYQVNTKEPDYVRVMENATVSETRHRMLQAYENRAAALNIPLLEKAIELRQRIANLMGFKNWVDYRVYTRMAKNSSNVISFLNDLKDKLAIRNKEDLDHLLTSKRKDDPSAKKLNAWDIRYWSNQVKKSELQVDDELVREFFPSEGVVSGLFQVYSKLFGIKIQEDLEFKTWADDVKLYQIREASDNQLIGYFYADFVPRAGKYGHAAAFTLRGARSTASGYSHPISAIVANFSAPESGKPSLLKFEEVKTLFHEFGHIMHQTLTRAPYASLSGSSVDQDFVEAPSQMLENWVYGPEILAMLSGHYKDPNKKLPKDLLDNLIKARDFNLGYFYTRQLLFAHLDMGYHTANGKVDTSKLYQDLHRDLVGIESIPDGHFPASFGHLMGGYDAGYYGYLWSEVYAADMFTRFERAGLLNSEVGMEYRRAILEQGKMKEANDLLVEFLGRSPNSKAFFKKLNIK